MHKAQARPDPSSAPLQGLWCAFVRDFAVLSCSFPAHHALSEWGQHCALSAPVASGPGSR